MTNGIIAGVVAIIFIAFFIYLIELFRNESKINKFTERMYIGNKYISKKLSVLTLNPYNNYSSVEIVGWKRNIAGIIFVMYKDEANVEYTSSITDFMKEFRIYKYAQCASSDFKKEIHQND